MRLPHRVHAVVLLLGTLLSMPLLLEAQGLPEADKSISAALQPFVERQALAGAVTLVANRERVLSVNSVGFADIEGHMMMRPDTIFWIASQSKPITALLLMMLVDEGKVNLDDPVSKYIPEFKEVWVTAEQDQEHLLLKRPKQAITVRHILSHTSGLPFKSLMEQPTLD